MKVRNLCHRDLDRPRYVEDSPNSNKKVLKIFYRDLRNLELIQNGFYYNGEHYKVEIVECIKESTQKIRLNSCQIFVGNVPLREK